MKFSDAIDGVVRWQEAGCLPYSAYRPDGTRIPDEEFVGLFPEDREFLWTAEGPRIGDQLEAWIIDALDDDNETVLFTLKLDREKKDVETKGWVFTVASAES